MNKLMKQCLVAGVVASVILIAGCDDTPKTKHEEQKELLAMQYAQERAMKDREIEMMKAQNGVTHQPTFPDSGYDSPSYNDTEYSSSSSTTRYQSTPAPVNTNVPQSDITSSGAAPAQGDSGFGVGAMALSALGGAAAGYFAGEMLNNGMKSYKDDRGNIHYTDKNGRPVKKEQYEAYKKQNPKTQAFRERAQQTKSTVAQKATNMKTSAQTKVQEFNKSEKVSGFRDRAQANKQQVKQSPAYQKAKQAPARAKQTIRPSSRGKRK